MERTSRAHRHKASLRSRRAIDCVTGGPSALGFATALRNRIGVINPPVFERSLICADPKRSCNRREFRATVYVKEKSVSRISANSLGAQLREPVARDPRLCHLKRQGDNSLSAPPSLPTRGAWIETLSRQRAASKSIHPINRKGDVHRAGAGRSTVANVDGSLSFVRVENAHLTRWCGLLQILAGCGGFRA